MENSKNMCLLRMASVEESLNAMAHLHDFDLLGRYDLGLPLVLKYNLLRRIQISFTRSKV